jgi:hypothetical protein
MRAQLTSLSPILFGLSMVLISHPSALANIPAAYLACEGAQEGEPCVMTGPQYGACLRDTLCEDPPETRVNECVLCVDACWAQGEGSSCVRPWSGEEGVCELQDRCTDREETSFTECVRCVELPPPSKDMRESAGCMQGAGARERFVLLFALLCVALGLARAPRSRP